MRTGQVQCPETDSPARQVVIPDVATIREMFHDAFEGLAIDSWRFARLMRRLIPGIVVWPFRLCDGSPIVFRAKFSLDLSRLDKRLRLNGFRHQLRRELTVDLFDAPQRAAFRDRIVQLRETMTQSKAAQLLSITKTAAQHAAGLDRLMRSLGLTDPYVAVTAPPTDMPKMRRHLHPRFKFAPLADFEPI